MDEIDFDKWLRHLLKAYPVVIGAALVGSRAIDQHSEDSDWDVVLKLEDSCYRPVERSELRGMDLYNATFYEQIEKIEQEITFDDDLHELDPDQDVDLFFLRPDGRIGQWHWYDIEDLVEVTAVGARKYLNRILESGMGLVKMTGSQSMISMAYTLYGRIHERDEKKIRKQFRRAKILYQDAHADNWLK